MSLPPWPGTTGWWCRALMADGGQMANVILMNWMSSPSHAPVWSWCCRKGRGDVPDFSRSSVKPAGACQWVCGTFFVTQQPGRREIRALPRPGGPSSSGCRRKGARAFHALSPCFPTFLGASEDSHLTANTSTDLRRRAPVLCVC